MKPARELDARYAGTCADCGGPIAPGERITYRRPDAVHATPRHAPGCLDPADEHERCQLAGTADAPGLHYADRPRCTLPETPTTTHRERLEAKAERRAEWAVSRQAKADAALDRGHAALDAIPFGQPIMGARDRNYRDKARASMARGFEHAKMADEHARKAEAIAAQTAGAIYDDDPDALDRLRAKLAALEAERARWTAYNAACRKRKPTTEQERRAIAAELLAPAERADLEGRHVMLRKYGQAPGYHTSNLTGNIGRVRDRIARLERLTA